MVKLSKLPYRKNVCCILFRGDKYLIVNLTGWKETWWKFPQGGIQDGETIEEAVKRELFEELSIKNFVVLKIFNYNNKYDWAKQTIIRHKSKWRGQSQTFCLVEFIGDDNEIRINDNEVVKFKWVDKNELLQSIVEIAKLTGNYFEIIQKIIRLDN